MIRTYFLTGLLVMSLIYVIESCIGRRRMLIGTSITDIFYNNNQNAVFLFCIQFYMVIIISRILFWSYEQNSPLKNRTIFEGRWHIKTICQFSSCLRKFLFFQCLLNALSGIFWKTHQGYYCCVMANNLHGGRGS